MFDEFARQTQTASDWLRYYLPRQQEYKEAVDEVLMSSNPTIKDVVVFSCGTTSDPTGSKACRIEKVGADEHMAEWLGVIGLYLNELKSQDVRKWAFITARQKHWKKDRGWAFDVVEEVDAIVNREGFKLIHGNQTDMPSNRRMTEWWAEAVQNIVRMALKRGLL